MTSPSFNVAESFAAKLQRLGETRPFAKSLYQTEVLQAAHRLLQQEDGVERLYEYADRFQQSGIFKDSPWEDPTKLQPHLVLGTLKSGGTYSLMETLSDLRMLSIAKQVYEDEHIPASAAEDFLNEVLALNLGVLYATGTEADRVQQATENPQVETLFRFLMSKLRLTTLLATLIQQIHRLAVQRPITVNRIHSMLDEARQLPDEGLQAPDRQCLRQYLESIQGPAPMSQVYPLLDDYRLHIRKVDTSALRLEAKAFAESMKETGLVAPQHAIFIRYIVNTHPDLFALSLGLNQKGSANFNEHQDIVIRLVKVAIHPATCQTLYGLALLLNHGVLSYPPVIPALERLVELDIRKDVAKALLSSRTQYEGLSETTVLLSGVLSVLGQPLGVGQGLNPTCQSARGISLWAQHATGYLLDLVARAARDGDIEIQFEGQGLHSQSLSGGLVTDFEKMDLDPVSIVLVPHLDRIYNEMMRRAAYRGEDAHKWVNPSFYGNWISKGFRSVVDPVTGSVLDFKGFVRLFYATHHPDYNDGYSLIYPNPVGIFITNIHGKLLGFHAISIQRVAKDSSGEYRVYFYNPNDNSSQNWGQNIMPSVLHHGEEEGESSLPFHEFVARLYAFHFNPLEQGDAYAIPDEVVQNITDLAQKSWGQEYAWAP